MFPIWDRAITRFKLIFLMCAGVQNRPGFTDSLIGVGRWLASMARPIIVNIHHQENTMNKDQAKGRLEEAKGKMKEAAGKAVGNKELELKGKVQNISGKAQAGFGDLKNDLKKAGTKK
jgi:uncharacterized protein YjbJ (UPF0337 family)